jgi:hypothetical protein
MPGLSRSGCLPYTQQNYSHNNDNVNDGNSEGASGNSVHSVGAADRTCNDEKSNGYDAIDGRVPAVTSGLSRPEVCFRSTSLNSSGDRQQLTHHVHRKKSSSLCVPVTARGIGDKKG